MPVLPKKITHKRKKTFKQNHATFSGTQYDLDAVFMLTGERPPR